MSAVFDALKQKALLRNEEGFTTTSGQSLGVFPGDDPWLTANTTMIGSTSAVGPVFVAYAAPIAPHWTIWGAGANLAEPTIVRSDSFFVPMQNEASTMGEGSVLFVDFGDAQRGVVALDFPRKKIYSEEITFFTAQLKRKTPSAIIGGRDYGEENA